MKKVKVFGYSLLLILVVLLPVIYDFYFVAINPYYGKDSAPRLTLSLPPLGEENFSFIAGTQSIVGFTVETDLEGIEDHEKPDEEESFEEMVKRRQAQCILFKEAGGASWVTSCIGGGIEFKPETEVSNWLIKNNTSKTVEITYYYFNRREPWFFSHNQFVNYSWWMRIHAPHSPI